MARCRQIIWDWNGTLFNDTWLCLDIMNEQLIKRGMSPLSYELYREIFDFPVRNYYEKAGFDFSTEPYERVAHDFIDSYMKRRFQCTLHFGVASMLQRFADDGFSHAILSAYAQKELGELLDHFEIKRYFSHYIGLDNHYASGKLNEGKTLLALLNADPSTVVMVGDTTHDHEVARELGIGSILIDHGHHNRKKLSTCMAPVVSSFAEIMAILYE